MNVYPALKIVLLLCSINLTCHCSSNNSDFSNCTNSTCNHHLKTDHYVTNTHVHDYEQDSSNTKPEFELTDKSDTYVVRNTKS